MRILDFADGFTSSSAPTTVDYPASNVEVTPSGNLASTTAQAAFVELQTDIDTINNKIGSANGIATLDGSSKIPTSQLPALALVDVNVVADIAGRDALTVQEGDVALVTDAGSGVSKTYIYDGSSWIELQANGSLASHLSDLNNPHQVTKTQVGLSNVSNDAQLKIASNLSDLANATTARSNLGLGNVDNTSDSTKNSATATLTNKTVGDALKFTEIASPSAPGSGRYLYAKSDGKFYHMGADGVETPVGSGSGSGGGINHISSNPDAETNTTGWSTYADAAGTSPVDGTGGSPNITFTRSTLAPLRSNANFLLTKDAANRQGEGVSFAFTPARADKFSVHTIKFDYEIASGTYVDGDLKVFIYDVTNSRVIEPVGVQILNSTVNSKHQAIFQLSDSVSYRLCFHVASTSTSAYSIKIDNVEVGPQVIARGPIITDWVSYTPSSFNGFGAATGNFFWRRVGGEIEIKGSMTVGTVTTAEARVALPTGITSGDSTAIPQTFNAGSYVRDLATSYNAGFILVQASKTYINFGAALSGGTSIGASAGTPRNADDLVGTGQTLRFEAKLPVAGWSSSQVLSSDAGTRVVAMYAYGPTLAAATNTPIKYPNVRHDTHGAYNASTGSYTAPESGFYQVHMSSDGTTAASWPIYISINGATTYTSGNTPFIGMAPTVNAQISGSGIVYVTAGQTIDVRPTNAYGAGSTQSNFLSIAKVLGPQQIGASEDVVCRVWGSTTSVPSASDTLMINPFVSFDSHSAYNTTTGRYTVPVSGKYRVTCFVKYDSYAWGANTQAEAYLFRDGSIVSVLAREIIYGAVTNGPNPRGSDVIQCTAGQILDVRLYHNRGSASALTYANSAITSYVVFEKIGN